MQTPNELGISFIANPDTPYATNIINVTFIGLDRPETALDVLLPPQHYLHPAAARITRAIDIIKLRNLIRLLIEMTPFEAFRSALSSRLREELLPGEDVRAEGYPGRPPHPLGQGVALSQKEYAHKKAYLEHQRKNNLAHYDTEVVNTLTAAGTNWPMNICRIVTSPASTPRSVQHKK